jgi:sugar/nucleoside kinase (ribokinase family)
MAVAKVEGFEVVALGALNVDLITTGSAVVEDTELARPREEILEILGASGTSHDAFLGGSAYNTIQHLARQGFGLRLAMIGVSGDVARDGLTRPHAEALQRAGVRFLGVASTDIAGTCGSVSSANGRKLWTDPGANVRIPDVLHDRLLGEIRGCRLLHISSLLEPLGSTEFEVAAAVANFVERFRADNAGSLITVDPGAPWARDCLATAVSRIFGLADVIFVNEQEFTMLTNGSSDGTTAVRRLRELCPRAAVHILKDVGGVQVQHPAGLMLATERRRTSAVAVDPTGAGDAVAAGVLAAIALDKPVTAGVRLGLRLAADQVGDVGDRGHGKHPLPEPWDETSGDAGVSRIDRAGAFAARVEPIARVFQLVVLTVVAILGVIVGHLIH